MSDMLRITGLASGMDTETMIQQLMRAENIKVDKVKQDKQYVEWQQEGYRDISNLLRGFKDEYFDILSSTNLRSGSSFSAFDTTYDGMTSSPYFKATATADATQGHYIISKVITAKSAMIKSTDSTPGDNTDLVVTSSVKGKAVADVDLGNISDGNNQFNVTLNGVSKVITISSGLTDTAALKNDLQSSLDMAFGSGKIMVNSTANNNGQINFDTDNTNTLSLSSIDGNTGLAAVGFDDTTNKSNKIDLNANLADITDSFATSLSITGGDVTDDDILFTINGESFSFNSATTSMNDIMTSINSNDNANVNMKYDTLTDKVVIESNKTGVLSSIDIVDTAGNFMVGSLGLDGMDKTAGVDASVVIDSGDGEQIITRSNNTFTANGISFELTKDTLGTFTSTNLSVRSDVDQSFDMIKGFVDKYNEVIDKINNMTSEKKYYDYKPLTEDQKEGMSEKEIEMWEEKAKSGLLRSDAILERITNNMRTALYDEVKGVGVRLFDIGIKTSVNYKDKGKLVIDESKLKKTLEESPSDVVELFTKKSSVSYNETANRGQRYAEEGLSNRLFDIIHDNIRTIRDSNGKKGILLEKAGIEGDITDFNNLLNKEIRQYDDRINDLVEDLADKEDYYYQMFARMESAMQRMNSQSQWLMSQMGGSM